MKTIEDLRKLLDCGKTNFSPLVPIGSGFIFDTNGIPCAYEIVKGWDIGIAIQCDSEWGDFNMKILDFIHNSDPGKQCELLMTSQLEDVHWNWISKHKHYYSEQYNWFFFIEDEKPQAACLVYHPKCSLEHKDTIFYIEFLAVAPWNRPNHISSQKFKGVGTLLLKNVIQYAEAHLGITKGFSLHALPKAEGFYEKIGMKRFTSNDKSGMGYFEMPECQKHIFLGNIA